MFSSPYHSRVGIISSSGGSVLKQCIDILLRKGTEVLIATDRNCGIEELQSYPNCKVRRFKYANKDLFSKEVDLYFKSFGGVDVVFLYFTRFIGINIFNSYLTINLHPSLLPSFPGMNSFKKTLESGVKIIGTTAHIVDEFCDSGPIISQISNSMHINADIQKILFLQKTFIQLVLLDYYYNSKLTALIENTERFNGYVNAYPSFITSEFYDIYQRILHEENVQILGPQ
jgi:folate-dependent phosphoribosylglycinamide formyltransferase PurN